MLKFGMVIKPELELLMQLEGANLVQYNLDDVHRHQKWKEQQDRKQKKENLSKETKPK